MLKSLDFREQVSQLVNKVTDPIKEARSRMNSKEEDHSAQQLLTWIEKEPSAAILTAWLKHLPEEALVALTGSVSAFCSELDIEMSWLLENQLDEEPKLKALVSEIVFNYLSACRKAALSWGDTRTFRVLRELESHLASDKPFTRQLYLMLVQNKLVQPVSTNLFLGQQEELDRYMKQEILQARETNKPAFKRVLKELIMEG